MTVRPGLLAVLIGSLISAAAAAVAMAATTGGGPVVLLGTAEDEPLTGRIAAELRALGIPIELRVVAGEEPGINLEVESALRDGARAAVRIDAQAGRTEVSIADPSSHRVALKQVLEGPPTAAMVPVLALRTVEFVRATLLGAPRGDDAQGSGEAMRDAAAGDAGIATSPSSKISSVQSMSRLRLALNSGAIFTPGGLSTQFTFGITARLRLLPRIGVEIMGFAPLSQGHVAFSETNNTLASSWIAGGGLFLRQPTSEHTAIELGSGVIVAAVEPNGQAGTGSGLAGQSDQNRSVAGYGRVGAELALARNLALRLDLLGGVIFQRAVLRIEPDSSRPQMTTPTVAAWDRTFAAALGGVEARWF